MKLEKLKEFVDFMNEHDLSELEVEEEGKKIRLKKGFSDYAKVIPQTVVHSNSQTAEVKKDEKLEDGIEIKSPMVGTFYSAPSPGAKPFVEIGDTIKSGDVVCIIEAMKLMNEIKSEVEGKVINIIVDNGSPIEFGQTLILVEPA